uniref:NH(3)-dependent NAD(+) synthetase n=1 Tax=Candidatus Methanophagaceae archaeon ANME-1 ERB6 TaxID=2759912 RepID=A0A7G9YSC4_9EURY|nr:NH(3)-dependent NAD(+) synthetase [Methanosarcinales archaeon ANME-1 ERB6]
MSVVKKTMNSTENENALANELVELMKLSVKENIAEAVLLSGGLDSSVVACLASEYPESKPTAIVVALEEGTDIHYSRLVAETFGLELKVKIFDIEDAIKSIPDVVKALNTYNPLLIRFGVAMYAALSYAKELDFSAVMTGDGGDELFFGYHHLFRLEQKKIEHRMEDKIRRIKEKEPLVSETLGNLLDIDVKQPFLDTRIIEFASKIPFVLKVRKAKTNGEGEVIGKWILRKAFEKFLPDEIIWRRKEETDISRGTDKLSRIVSSRMSDVEFKRILKEAGVTSREEAYYYKMMR